MEIPENSKWFIKIKKISIEEIVKIFQTLKEKKDDSKWIKNYKETNRIDIRKIIEKIGPINENNSNWLKKFQEEFNRKITIQISGIFYNCSSIESLPDISNWNIKNVDDLSYVF